jgi:hypothetical protein
MNWSNDLNLLRYFSEKKYSTWNLTNYAWDQLFNTDEKYYFDSESDSCCSCGADETCVITLEIKIYIHLFD